MINPLELRLGNHVLYNGQIAVVSGINSPAPRKDKNFDGKYVIEIVLGGLIDCTPEELEPIILTESLLLDFGFEKTEKMYSTWFNHYYWHIVRGDIRFDLVDNGDLSCVDYKHIVYLHQLQNLIFSIDNTELKNG